MSDVYDWKNYGDWLLDLVGFSRKGYLQLMRSLHFIDFEPLIGRDINRVKDGQELRKDYYDLTGISLWGSGTSSSYIPQRLLENASVLEVLVALAFRIENEYIGDPADPRPEMIFWEMICNLGLQKYVGKYYDEEEVHDILETWISRRYSYNGRGGIFPLKHPIKDQRKIEIWDQMMAYLSKQYFS